MSRSRSIRNAVVWDGSVHIVYDDVELDCDVLASGTSYYYPGCAYNRNGDPGDPPEGDITVESLDVEYVYLEGTDITSWLNQDTLRAITEECMNAIVEGQLGSGERAEPEPEPDELDD